ncbi:hypothetical protein SDJN02_17038, partial [Cucurbita argyrosperma subsp. argyrosperma]
MRRVVSKDLFHEACPAFPEWLCKFSPNQTAMRGRPVKSTRLRGIHGGSFHLERVIKIDGNYIQD